jgi:hypothetical protein
MNLVIFVETPECVAEANNNTNDTESVFILYMQYIYHAQHTTFGSRVFVAFGLAHLNEVTLLILVTM